LEGVEDMDRSVRRGVFAPLALVLVVLLLGAAGCGDSEDGGGDGGGSADAADSSTGGGETSSGGDSSSAGDANKRKFTGDAAGVNEALVGIQDDFDNVDGESYCDRLTPAGIKQVETFGKSYGAGTECVQIMNTVADNTRKAGVEQKPSVLLKVKVDGDRAVATISNGGRPPEPMVFVKHDGEWKIPDPGFGDSGTERRLSSDPEKRAKQVEQVQKQVERQRREATKEAEEQSGQ
jgi:hypothetical protein